MTTRAEIDSFFSDPNEVNPARLEGPLDDLVRLLLARLSLGSRTLLPARVGGVTRWYGLAPTEREGRLLREEVRCWLGRPISTQPVSVLAASDPVDRAALDIVPGGVVTRMDVAAGWQSEARTNVASLTDVWALAPERAMDEPRPVGRVLRQFYEGLLAGDRSLAEAALDEIRGRSLLNATNIRFLRVELLSSLGTPEEIRDDPALRDISRLARPSAVTERIAAAADVLFFEPALLLPSPEWPSVAEALEDTWPGLVTDPEQVTSLATARCFSIREMLSERPRGSFLRQVAERFPDDPVVRAALAVPVTEAEQPQSRAALALYFDGDYGAALQAAEAEPLTRSTVSIGLASAFNLGGSSAAVRALTLLDRLPPAERDHLLSMAVDRTFYEQLVGGTSNAQIPDGWLAWLRGDWDDRPDLLTEWATGWSREPQDLARDAEELAGDLIDALSDHRRGRIRNGLPVFIDWLVGDGLAPSGVGLATTVFDILLSSEPGRTERQASLVLLEEVLSTGCTSAEYRELLESTFGQLELLGPRDATWLAQVLGLFMLFTCPDSSARERLFSKAAGVAASWSERIEPADATVLQLVLADAGLQVPQIERATEGGHREGANRFFRSVGIYSLLENASRVAVDWITKLFPDVEVKTSSEHTNSQSLTALVRWSDVMLVQTSRAKHAATLAIEAASQDDKQLILVHGRGATALVRALLGWVNGDSGL